METGTLTEQIQRLELDLLQCDLNAHPGLIDELLAQDFEEIDNQGHQHSREDVIEWLKQKDPKQLWAFRDFRIKPLTGDCVLAIYSLQRPPQSNAQGSIRTSLWQRQGNQWKMVFHQATKITETSAS